MSRIFAVDGNFYLHRIAHTQPAQSRDPEALLCRRFVGLVSKDSLAIRAKRVIIAFDGNEVFRYALYEGYKQGRKGSNGVYEYLPSLIDYLALCGLPVIQLPAYEADDILASVAFQNDDVVLGTKDKDCYQTLREGVAMYDSTHKVNGLPAPRIIKHTDVEGLMKVPYDKFLDLQTLLGDKIDNVPRLVSPSKAIQALNTWGSIHAWYENDENFRNGISPRIRELKLNRKLVKLKRGLDVKIPPIQWNNDPDMTLSYIHFKQWCNPKSKGLFSV